MGAVRFIVKEFLTWCCNINPDNHCTLGCARGLFGCNTWPGRDMRLRWGVLRDVARGVKSGASSSALHTYFIAT